MKQHLSDSLNKKLNMKLYKGIFHFVILTLLLKLGAEIEYSGHSECVTFSTSPCPWFMHKPSTSSERCCDHLLTACHTLWRLSSYGTQDSFCQEIHSLIWKRHLFHGKYETTRKPHSNQELIKLFKVVALSPSSGCYCVVDTQLGWKYIEWWVWWKLN